MTQRYIIIGDGVAGATAAEKLRDETEDAEIKVFTEESEPLYNRIMLKNFMKSQLPGKEFTKVHDENWYENRNIDLFLDTRVDRVDTEENTIETEDGDKCYYDKCLIATGGSPRELPQDQGYDNLYYMWTMQDAEEIKKSAEESDKAVVVGGGLLGIDLAMAYASNGCDTDYLIRGSNWFSRGLDGKGAEIMHTKMEEKGINIVTETEVDGLNSQDDKVVEVVSKDGKTFECDAVAVAIGQTPNSSLINVDKNSSGMIKADSCLKTSDSDVYAAGNMVEYYSPVFEKRNVNGSWDHSEAMGKFAAKNMLGAEEEFDFVNTYGVGHFDVQFLSVGNLEGTRKVVEDGSESIGIKFYKNDRVTGAISIGGVLDIEEVRKEISGS